MTTRRRFLQRLTHAAVAAPALLAWGRTDRSCVVIGAGLAGLAAADVLVRAGWRVTVLEARGRIGGRVLSRRMAADPALVCELGGEWIGAGHERVIALCRDLGLDLQDHRFDHSLVRGGQVVAAPDWPLSPAGRTALSGFFDEYPRLSDDDLRRLDQIDWQSHLIRLGLTEDDVRLRARTDCTDFGAPIDQVSAYVAASHFAEAGPANAEDFKVVGGNSRLASALARRIGPAAFRLNTPVSAVRQHRGRVTVTSAAGEFTADACICTVPAPLLSTIEFDPGLPEAQRTAARQLEYARISKSAALFRKRFWGEERFSLVGGAASDSYFHSTLGQPGVEGILCGYAVGAKSDALGALDSRRRLDAITRDLLPVSAAAPVLARDIISYDWHRDRYAGGAYALYQPGQWFTLRPALQAPHGRVLFAGEHLAECQGFMEGAVVSGQDAAETLRAEG